MKLKDAFLGVLIVALIASEILLFSANQQKREALAQLSQARHETQQARADAEQSKSDDDNARSSLRAENQKLAQQNVQLISDNNQLRSTNQQLTEQLETARDTTQSQQQYLEKLQAQNQQAVVEAAAKSALEQHNVCINNLRQIDAAKNEWALENGKAVGDLPTPEDLLPYLPNGEFPVCPSDGIYTIAPIGTPPSCSVHGQLPSQ